MAGKRLIDIQPFDRGNEETAFLLMNRILASEGYCPITVGTERREAYRQASPLPERSTTWSRSPA